MPDDVLRDDPPTPGVQDVFRIDVALFRYTLARLPAVRGPWLRDIFERPARHMHAGNF